MQALQVWEEDQISENGQQEGGGLALFSEGDPEPAALESLGLASQLEDQKPAPRKGMGFIDDR